MRKIKRIFIHCSASPHEIDGKPVDVDMIDRWHKDRGWQGCGYHSIIIKDGTIQPGRPEEIEGAGAKGNNKDSLHCCVVGDDCFTVAQLNSLKAQLRLWMTRYHVRLDQVYCHYQVNPDKTCPNASIEDLRELLFRS